MQQGSSRTPCRRLGLSRISLTPKSGSSPMGPLPNLISKSPSLYENQTPCGPPKRHLKDASEHAEKCIKTDQSTYHDKGSKKMKRESLQVGSIPTQPCIKTQCSGHGDNFTPEALLDLSTLRKRVALKEKQVQQLTLTQLYQKKHDPDQLMLLVQQWLQGCQEALQELFSELNNHGTSITMLQLLQQLAIPPALVNFDVDTSEFLD